MKLTFIALLLVTIVSCQYPNKNPVRSPDNNSTVPQEQTSAYEDVSNNIDQMSKDILSSIKTNNYASFSKYLSSKDTVVNFIEDGFKRGGLSAKDIAELTEDADEKYAKSLITTKRDFDYIIKKGIQQGIIWSDITYDGADWKLAQDHIGTFPFHQLELTVNFKYKGVGHTIRFDNSAFFLIGSKWVLSENFHLDDFISSAQTEQTPKNDNNSNEDSSYEATPIPDSSTK